MKKLLILFVSVAICTASFAQSEHLTFKNIPIDGNISSFIEKMKSEGFVLDKMIGSAAIMKGRFVNKDCDIYIISSPQSNTVWKVGVYLPAKSSWSSLKSEYQSFKSDFTVKYGAPDSQYAFFSKPYYEGDGYELQALRKEKCTYASFGSVARGALSVKIGESGQVVFAYEDGANSEVAEKEKSAETMNDI